MLLLLKQGSDECISSYLKLVNFAYHEIVPELKTIDLNTLNVTTLVLATYEVLVQTNPSETNPLDHSMKL